MPAAFATTTAAALKSGWGFMLVGNTPWDLILKALRRYAALQVDQYDARTAALKPMPGLIAAWEAHHKVGTKKLTRTRKPRLPRSNTSGTSSTPRFANWRAPVCRSTSGPRASPRCGSRVITCSSRCSRASRPDGRRHRAVGDQDPASARRHLAPRLGQGHRHLRRRHRDGDQEVSSRRMGVPESGIVDRKTMDKLATIFQGPQRRVGPCPGARRSAQGRAGRVRWGAAPAELTAGTRDLAGTGQDRSHGGGEDLPAGRGWWHTPDLRQQPAGKGQLRSPAEG